MPAKTVCGRSSPDGLLQFDALGKGCTMPAAPMMELELDFIEEIRLRRWARENYCAPDDRDEEWHPVIHEEMHQKDLDTSATDEE